MLSEIFISIGIVMGLGLLFSTILAISYKKLKVYEDPRIDRVEAMLPGANCGACSMPGCRAFAEVVVKGELQPSKCTVSSEEALDRIANYLGVEAGDAVKMVARILCAGGRDEAHNRADYKGGLSTCRGEAVVAGGPKDCNWGCLGLGDCATICDFDAIRMGEDALPHVDPSKCTACGDCVEICPKDLFQLMPIEHKLIVQCKSLLEGTAATDKCSVACNACGRCAADAAPGLIEIRNGLARINYGQYELATHGATKRCPTGAIVWLDSVSQFELTKSETNEPGRVEFIGYDEDTYYQ